MNGLPLLSILIPVYNSEDTVLRTLSSLPMGCEGINVFIFDDGSTDRSLELCSTWASEHPDNVFILRSSHIGVSAGRKRLAECATGLFSLFVDSDDYLDTGLFINVIDYLRAHIDSELISMPYLKISDNKEEIVDLEPEKLNEFIERILLHSSSNSLQTKIIRTSLLKEAQFNPAVSIGEDKIILGSIALKLTSYKKLNIPAPVVDARSRKSLTRKKPEKYLFNNLSALYESLFPLLRTAGLLETKRSAENFWTIVGGYSAKAVKNRLFSHELYKSVRTFKNTEVYKYYRVKFSKEKRSVPLKSRICMMALGI